MRKINDSLIRKAAEIKKQKMKTNKLSTLILDPEDDKFIQQAVTFGSTIGKYTALLGVDPGEVALLKEDVKIVVYLSSHSSSYSPSFIRHNLSALHTRLVAICDACMQSKKYNRAIGIVLGLETTVVESPFYTETWRWLFGDALHGPPHFQ